MISQELIDLMRSVDTPTICNAIEVAEGKRGFSRFTRKTMFASDPNAQPLVGLALTAKIAANKPPVDSPDVIKKRRMDYYRYVAKGARPGVIIIEDEDGKEACGAYWGEVNATVHQAFGLEGVVTNGLMRDLGDLPIGFPIIAGAIGPSHGFVHVRDFNCPVSVLGMTVVPGDIIHADRHGAAVVPAALLNKMPAAIAQLLASEALILEPARKEGFDFDAFEKAWTAFEKAKT